MRLSSWILALGAVVTAGFSVALLRWSVSKTPIWPVVWRAGFGALLLVVAIYLVWRVFRRGFMKFPETKALLVVAVVGLLLIAAGVITTVVASRLFISWLAPIGLVLVIFGLIAGYEVTTQLGSKAPATIWRYGVVMLLFAIPIISAASIATKMLGLAWALVGLTLLKIGVNAWVRDVATNDPEEWRAQVTERSWRAVGSATVGAFMGITLLLVSPTVGGAGLHPLLDVAAVVLVISGLSAIGLAAYDISPELADEGVPWWPWGLVAVVGLALAVLFGFWLHVPLPSWWSLSLTVLAVGLTIGVFFVWRGAGVVLLVLLGFVLTWVLIDRTEDPAAIAGDDGVIVAFGDSFTSGQGGSGYADGSNTLGDDGHSCQRSAVAYAEWLGQMYSRQVLNLACDGAKMEHVTSESQGEIPKGGPAIQLEQLPESTNADLVVVSIGGNDVQFSTVVLACILPSDCSEVGERFMADVDLIADELASTYKAIRARVGDAPIVVVPYPKYFDDVNCDLALTADEIRFANDFLDKLNGMIEHVATSAEMQADGVHFFPGMNRAYLGHRQCDNEPGANLLRLVPHEGPTYKRLNPTTWYQASMHPTDLGHACTAAAMQGWLAAKFPQFAETAQTSVPCVVDPPTNDELVVRSADRPAEADPSLFTADKGCVAEIDDPAMCFDEDAWVVDQLKVTVGKLALPLSGLVLAGLLFALGVARLAGGRWEWAVLLPVPPEPPEVG